MPGRWTELTETEDIEQFGYFGFGARRTFPMALPIRPNAQPRPRLGVWAVRRDWRAAAQSGNHFWNSSAPAGIVIFAVNRATPGGNSPRKTMSVGTVIRS